MRKNRKKADLRRRFWAVGLFAAATLCMTGCNTSNQEEVEGSIQQEELSIEYGQPNAGGAEVPSNEAAENNNSAAYDEIEAGVEYSPMEVPIEY